jgi:hypothetical protein
MQLPVALPAMDNANSNTDTVSAAYPTSNQCKLPLLLLLLLSMRTCTPYHVADAAMSTLVSFMMLRIMPCATHCRNRHTQ